MRSPQCIPSPLIRAKAGKPGMVQEGGHARHLLPCGFSAVACQSVVATSFIVFRRAAGEFFDEALFEHQLDGPVQRARAELYFAGAALRDVEHDAVAMERL